MKILPLILCGGLGIRLQQFLNLPKQFLRLFSNYSMLQHTVMRFTNIDKFLPPVFATNVDYYSILQQHIIELNIKYDFIILEPCYRNTSPAIATAIYALKQKYENNLKILVLPIDHYVHNISSLVDTILNSAHYSNNNIITFGTQVESPNNNYGYIKKGNELLNNNDCKLYKVNKFIEKPNENLAAQLFQNTLYRWNSGMYLSELRILEEALLKHSPITYGYCSQSIQHSITGSNLIMPNPDIYKLNKNESIDKAVIQKSHNLILSNLNTKLQDIGTLNALLFVLNRCI